MSKKEDQIQTLENFWFDTISSKQIVECLPGIFYLYEKNKEGFYLKFWNKNHEIVTGYSSKELLNMSALTFFDKKDHKTILDGIEKIMTSGKAQQVFGNLKLKDKTTIPYLFEGHLLQLHDKVFFMGSGIDISLIIDGENRVKQVTNQLFIKERELLSNMVENEKNTNFINYFNSKIDKILLKNEISEIKTNLSDLKSEILFRNTRLDKWAFFKAQFINIHPDFFIDLKSKHPELTKNDFKYLSYLKLNLGFNQISSLLNISKEGVKKRRYRIKKKLELKENISLDEYIENI